jgi:hypothetical protein
MYETAPSTIALAALKAAFEPHFDKAETVIRRCRETGLIAAGAAGRCGSARLTAHDAALLLVALAVPCDPIDAPDEAQRIAAFTLCAVDFAYPGEPLPRRCAVDDGTGVTFHDTLSGEIKLTVDRPDYTPDGWCLARHEAVTRDHRRLVFADAAAPLGEAEPLHSRWALISSAMIGTVAALFDAQAPPVPFNGLDLGLMRHLRGRCRHDRAL